MSDFLFFHYIKRFLVSIFVNNGDDICIALKPCALFGEVVCNYDVKVF